MQFGVVRLDARVVTYIVPTVKVHTGELHTLHRSRAGTASRSRAGLLADYAESALRRSVWLRAGVQYPSSDKQFILQRRRTNVPFTANYSQCSERYACCTLQFWLHTFHCALLASKCSKCEAFACSNSPAERQTVPFEAGCGTRNSIFEGGNLPSTRKPAKAGI